ncbi:trimethylamine methyltransferase family protein [Clostridium sp.]|uniref:trimethylamine methyltransferase family protein n=1 Tax=Clostridium sp. TaxID=1506 RepID=UPI003F40F451
MSTRMENVDRLHNATIQVLEEVGMEFKSERALDVLRSAGIRVEGSRAYFTEEEINKYVGTAPSEFKLDARNPKNSLRISRETHTYTCGYGCSKIRDFDGHIRDAVLEDHLNILEIIHQSPFHGINGGILAQPNEVNQDLSYQIMTFANMYKTDKPIIFMPTKHEIFKQLMEMGCILFGGKENLTNSPKTLSWMNPLSPLSITPETVESIFLCCEYNQAIAVTVGSMSGATSPITSAGTIVMNNAELLGIIALIQIIKPGHPVVHGLSPLVMDMQTNSASVASPQYTKICTYGEDLSKKYNLPFRASGTQSDANGVTGQTGYESMMNCFSARKSNASLIMQGAGILDGYATISYDKLIMDLEVISAVEYYFEDVVVNDKTIAIDTIKQVAQSGQNFLGSKHTAKFCRKEPWRSEIGERGKLTLTDTPNNLFKQNIDNKLQKMYDSYEVPHMDEEIKKELIDYVLNLGVDDEIVNKILTHNKVLA